MSEPPTLSAIAVALPGQRADRGLACETRTRLFPPGRLALAAGPGLSLQFLLLAWPDHG